MNEFSSPIPPPSGDLCPVCRQPLQGRPKLCPNCGAVLSQFSAGASCLVTLASMVLVLLALGFGGAGACFLLLSAGATGTNAGQMYVNVAFCLAAAFGCGWAVWKLNRRKK